MEIVYENATKVDKRITYKISESRNARTVIIKAGNTFKLPMGSGFEIIKSETVE
ncbi:hypothetical protein HYP58_gp75 [Vibrio phage 1.097.O._10N.286.49.B3]|uniref:Uncharacterized protein n=1 Tax=Vibrio phage 1.097.O._10N.286.49.B3 TaxID=1881383 RepID=A0A2I7R0P8_9CAUD|nr:hypothetical protein HYP58_gp75 [Vibrio phage 1.097.O._10N.286.49.B3]AUR87221.1 hypothetical protein NVP1097O_75 [Vibrio phage 1.097.O._10N.286.49.B3]